MSGVSVVWYILKSNTALISAVPEERIKSGVLPLKTVLPAISVASVDGFDAFQPVDMPGTARMLIERVQVTVLAKTYPSKNSIMDLVRKALPLSRGTINSILVDSILPDSLGPDLDDPETQIYTLSRDFIVRWHEVAS